MDQGLDSLGVTEVASRLGNEFGLRLSPTVVFSYPTICALVDHISALLGLNVQQIPSSIPLSVPESTLSFLPTSAHQDGDALGSNPWFSAYLSGSPK
jgi:hypothetical protein